MKQLTNVLFFSLLFAAGLSGLAEEKPYNCAAQAVAITSSDENYELPTVREWDPDYQVPKTNAQGEVQYDSHGDIIWLKVGRWVDGGDDNTVVSNQIGCCYLSVSLQKGLDYVVRVTNGVGVVQFQAVDTVMTGFQQKQDNNYTYYYIDKSDWASLDPETAGFRIYLFRGVNTVGKGFELLFEQASVDKYIEPDSGTEKHPIALDVTNDGSATIQTSTETRFGRFCTTYSAALKAGITYYFVGTYPSSDVGVLVTSAEWEKMPQGSSWQVSADEGLMSITVSADHTIQILTMPNDDEGGNVGGGRLAWGVGHMPEPEKEPKIILECDYAGSLEDDDGLGFTASFSVHATVYDNGTTNYSAQVKMADVTYDFAAADTGAIEAENVFCGKNWISRFDIEPNALGLSVSGSLRYEDDGSVDEAWFDGVILPYVDPGSDSFLKYDPTTDSASDMGLTCAAFRDEPAGSETLQKLWDWATVNGVKISEANGMAFTDAGDPENMLSEAYLLDCAAAADVVAAEKAKFRITAFDPATGPVVAGTSADGDAYGNGCIEVRTSQTVGGTYTPDEKPGVDKLFYRAYLVK